ncbi:P-loop containing nucleoside triphosphate hydrolase protein [Mycena leptocephala]|nr:P-loop containing nucleoside triphosphate hydrolase protein [Mycena leptocephala]
MTVVIYPSSCEQRLVQSLFNGCSSPCLSRLITYVSNPDSQTAHGWALVGGFVCTYAAISLMTSLYWEKVFNCTVRYRGALVGNIHAKTLRLSSAAGREMGGGVASTYMSVDVERVCQGLETIHELWAAVVSISLAVALLYSQTTWPAFLPLMITFIVVMISGYVSEGIGGAHRKWLGSTDKRVKFLVSIINNYLPMKLGRYEDAFAQHAAHLRAEEMKGARSFYYNLTAVGALTETAWAASTLAVLGPYSALAATGHGALDSRRLFTIVATINLLAPPLSMLGDILPQLSAAYSSLKRIEYYLQLEELVPRLPPDADGGSQEKQPDDRSAHISLQEASFSWGADKPPFLGPISLDLSVPHLYVCIGPVASGKTFFLLSLLGETVCTGGDFSPARTPIAYAAQDPLIISGTIRDNIVFGQEFYEEWYNTVLNACALTVDINRMTSKDGMFVGERGATLSGGQRQRISLARAVYAKAPWTFLDDSFSALDAETEEHIFLALFGPNGLLRNRGVILVTHNGNYYRCVVVPLIHLWSAKHLNSADRVVVLSAGTMEYHGTLEEIVALGYNFDRDMNPDRDLPTTKLRSPEEVIRTKDHIDEQESGEKGIPKASRGFTPYLFYMRMAGLSGSLAVIVRGILSLSFGNTAKLALDPAVADRVDLSTAVVWKRRETRRGLGGRVCWSYAGQFSICRLWDVGILYRHYRVGAHTGLRFQSLTTAVQSCRTKCTLDAAARSISGSSFVFRINSFWTDHQPIFPFGSLVFILVGLQQLGAATQSPLYTLFSTTVSGLVTIRFASICFLRTFLSLISFIIATGLSALAVGFRHSTSPSSLGLALASLTSLTTQLSSLLMNLSDLENTAVAVSRIHEIATLPKEDDLGRDGDAGSSPSEKEAVRGAVVFDNIRLQYRPDLTPALRTVSFRVSAGQKVGVCGRTGSGKSSLIMAMFRAVEASLMSGQVFIDGVDTKMISLEKLRDSLSLVAQNPFIWHASIRHNLDPHEICTDQDIWLALERVELSLAVSELPDKLETLLEESGLFSGGQRQLLCMARVLLRKRKIVVLDEASSSLDAGTDKKIREVIRVDLSECTVISVAHRIETIIDFDLILVMEDGTLVESGAPQDLLRLPESQFARLALSQGLRFTM